MDVRFGAHSNRQWFIEPFETKVEVKSLYFFMRLAGLMVLCDIIFISNMFLNVCLSLAILRFSLFSSCH